MVTRVAGFRACPPRLWIAAMTVQLHILNAGGRLSPLLEHINEAFARGARKSCALIPVSYIDVVVQASQHVIPEIGLLGQCYQPDVVYLSIDPENRNLSRAFDTEFIAALGHELHHAMRHRGPAYGDTLGQALVSEGLACHFETELRAGEAPFYAKAFDTSELEVFFAKAKGELHERPYDHRAWFFGSDSSGLPRHIGYSLGFWLVDRYIESRGIPASQLWDSPPEEFYRHP